VAFTRDFRPEEIGRSTQASLTLEAVLQAMASAGIQRIEDVHYVQIKCPLLTAAGIELLRNEVLVLGNAPGWDPEYPISHAVMEDALDVLAVDRAMASTPEGEALELTSARLVGLLVKAEPSACGSRHVMSDDSDINASRRAEGDSTAARTFVIILGNRALYFRPRGTEIGALGQRSTKSVTQLFLRLIKIQTDQFSALHDGLAGDHYFVQMCLVSPGE
jgi:hypothetical protein